MKDSAVNVTPTYADIDDRGIVTYELSKAYKNFLAVDKLTLSVESGDIFGFLGPNGAGKTTTIRMLCGLLLPSTGNAKVAGFDVVKDSLKIRRIIGLLPESSGFYNWMNAEEYLLHLATLHKVKSGLAKKRVADLLEKVGLASKAFAPIGYYSRGMKQRLGLARALINKPRIIFLDEPTLGLDPKGQQDIQRILLELNREEGVTIFLSSHALSEVSSLCNKVAIVNRGRLIAQGTLDELRRLAGEDSHGSILIRVFDSTSTQKKIADLPFQIKSRAVESGFVNLSIYDNQESVNSIVTIFEKSGLQIYEIRRLQMSLEDVFFRLTETKLRKKQQQIQKSGGEFQNHA